MDQSAGRMKTTGEKAAEKRTYRVHLGRGVEASRLRRGLTRKSLANRLKVTPKLLGNWERGASRPPIEKVVELCRVLRVTVEDLLDEGERREAYLLRRHEGPEVSERSSDMSEETTTTETTPEPGPGVEPEPGLKSERLQEPKPVQ
jgi:transcriptional regulator with XRE-family HTH domain